MMVHRILMQQAKFKKMGHTENHIKKKECVFILTTKNTFKIHFWLNCLVLSEFLSAAILVPHAHKSSHWVYMIPPSTVRRGCSFDKFNC